MECAINRAHILMSRLTRCLGFGFRAHSKPCLNISLRFLLDFWVRLGVPPGAPLSHPLAETTLSSFIFRVVLTDDVCHRINSTSAALCRILISILIQVQNLQMSHKCVFTSLDRSPAGFEPLISGSKSLGLCGCVYIAL